MSQEDIEDDWCMIEDEGWKEELIKGSKPRLFEKIDSILVKNNLIVQSKGNIFIFLTASNSWSVIVSAEAQKQICDMVGSDNVSVNYLTAAEPYLSYISKVATRIASIPTSICIGTHRLNIFSNDDSMKFVRCETVIPIMDYIDPRIGGFCVMPCHYKKIPTIWPFPTTKVHSLERYLEALFVDRTEYETIKWIVGLALTDPGRFSMFLLLYGPGGTGKSEVVNVILDVLGGCAGSIKASQVTDLKAEMNINTAKALASNRIVTAGELNLSDGKINTHIIKEMTGHDSILIPPIRVATRCSVITSSNNLPNPRVHPDWLTTAIARRAVVVPMNVSAALLPKVERPDSEEECLDFLLSCVHTFIRNESIPMSTRSLLYSILGSGYEEIFSTIAFDDNATMQDIMDASSDIEKSFGIPDHQLGELAGLKCPDSVVCHAGNKFIKNIKLVKTE